MKQLPTELYPGVTAVVEFLPGELVCIKVDERFDQMPNGQRLHLVYAGDVPLPNLLAQYERGQAKAVGLAVGPATAEAPLFISIPADVHVQVLAVAEVGKPARKKRAVKAKTPTSTPEAPPNPLQHPTRQIPTPPAKKKPTIKLLIFDADGTLIDRKAGELLPGVENTLRGLPKSMKLAIATNQGGPACRDQGWGNHYPTLQEVEKRYYNLANAFGARLYMCLLYIGKDGQRYKPAAVNDFDDRLDPDWRKPSPGMLEEACREANVEIEEAMMIGDSQEDHDAAEACGMAFRWADDYFGR